MGSFRAALRASAYVFSLCSIAVVAEECCFNANLPTSKKAAEDKCFTDNPKFKERRAKADAEDEVPAGFHRLRALS